VTTARNMKRTVEFKPNLREVQKASTRRRILEAAREVFYRAGYYGATVDQIVSAVGASRQTFYLHFSDKEQILAQLIADYNARGATFMERLPGPRPTLDQLRAWLLEVSVFFEEEKASFSVLGEVSAHPATHSTYGKVTPDINRQMTIDIWMNALAGRAPAFAAAMTGKASGLEALARGRLLILETIWAASLAWEQRGSDLSELTLTIVAKSFHEFLHDPRFAAKPVSGKQKSKQPVK
jgi:AcrR family transcriptional regulator